jgi:hypothetical protein
MTPPGRSGSSLFSAPSRLDSHEIWKSLFLPAEADVALLELRRRARAQDPEAQWLLANWMSLGPSSVPCTLDRVNRSLPEAEGFFKWGNYPEVASEIVRIYRTIQPKSSLPRASTMFAAGGLVCFAVCGYLMFRSFNP